jgi:hypothetical protein
MPKVLSELKKDIAVAIRENYEKHYKSRNEIFLDCWFSESTQRILKDASQKF